MVNTKNRFSILSRWAGGRRWARFERRNTDILQMNKKAVCESHYGDKGLLGMAAGIKRKEWRHFKEKMDRVCRYNVYLSDICFYLRNAQLQPMKQKRSGVGKWWLQRGREMKNGLQTG